ncbi:hypothetical protein [Tranquillimonas alkanivorans]|uniref:Uncharacterized protein n=1 Tax=Tranquillimonas alkanivorans TaxID=441119 RepID=A0A1I5TUD5_9RHOB|nr:hypothetical protein [Tranquillimonas alkanivorans]SFP86653.1 hypothetical protein SAMN04488047_11532 [Tranquillimonas alkanivorans]
MKRLRILLKAFALDLRCMWLLLSGWLRNRARKETMQRVDEACRVYARWRFLLDNPGCEAEIDAFERACREREARAA